MWSLRALVLAAAMFGSTSCGGSSGGSQGTPLAAAERALTLASAKDELGFAKMLARGPRGKSTANVQLEMLS